MLALSYLAAHSNKPHVCGSISNSYIDEEMLVLKVNYQRNINSVVLGGIYNSAALIRMYS